ncbi:MULTISPECIES: acyl-CoA thioesterase II [unclassified Azospirillum]|uniref:acyl-CoA thioesterase n=1 Tax=unclassified Azospirillum TaxID=2630922 RepID=UPI000B741623|nr:MULTISPECIES: acyl-CoA thioesterase II [unclassified Azospirillum]SNT08797.1 (3S)-malyl-CoA thioesterase [Azospirillum sp. RU38E]SNT23145.1 (3S)-malyl-CoA thioesterase [Azospirillum sp. RU37A]
MTDALDRARTLVNLLSVEQLEDNLFRGVRTDETWGRVYGGQVVAQALASATCTVAAARPVHSLHAYFLRPGDPQRPIIYQVERDMDGRSFSNRRVIALQGGKVLLNMAASFHIQEPGLHHAAVMPVMAGPEGMRSDRDMRLANLWRLPSTQHGIADRMRSLEFYPVEEQIPDWPGAGALQQHYWFRTVAPLPDDPVLHRAVLAYASDWGLIGIAAKAHGKTIYDDYFEGTSLDHALWIHDPHLRLDEWLLYAQETPWTGGARGLGRGLIFSRDGRLVASVVQEGLLRPRPPGTDH